MIIVLEPLRTINQSPMKYQKLSDQTRQLKGYQYHRDRRTE